MRKTTLIGLVALTTFAIVSAVSAAPLAENWAYRTSDLTPPAWLGTGNTERGGNYNAVTDNVYVVSRAVALSNRVTILDAATGTETGNLDTTGISGGTFDLNDVAVATDGVIYGCNLTVTGNPLTIYRWTSEAASPTVAFTGDLTTVGRQGDALAVRGSGVATEIFVGGGSGNNGDIQVFTTADGSTFTNTSAVTTGSANSWGGIAPRTDNTNIIYNNPGSQSVELTLAGALVDTANGAVEGASFSSTGFWINGLGDALLVEIVGNVADPGFGRVFGISGGLTNITTVADTGDLGTNANGNAAGAAVFDTVRGAAIVLCTNNGIGSFGSAVPVELSVFSSD